MLNEPIKSTQTSQTWGIKMAIRRVVLICLVLSSLLMLFNTVSAAPPAVTILSPNGGETLTDRYVNVTWSASDPDNDPITVNIYYDINEDKNDGRILISSSETNDGNYIWDLIGVVWGYHYLSIDAIAGLDITTDYSDGTFIKAGFNTSYISNIYSAEVTANSQPHVELVPCDLPALRGVYPVKFNVSDPDGDALFADIYYSEVQGSRNHTIAQNLVLSDLCDDSDQTTETINNCLYNWNTSDVNGNYYIDIVVTDGSLNATNSTSNITIDNEVELTILHPGGGEIFTSEFININWTASDIEDWTVLLNIYYDNDNNALNGRTLISANEINDGNYIWDISSVVTGNYYISIDAISSGLNCTGYNVSYTSTDYSDGSFVKAAYMLSYTSNTYSAAVNKNTPPYVEVIAPNGFENINGTYTIKFNVSDAEDDILAASIYYSEVQGGKNHTIIENLDLSNAGICTDPDKSTVTENGCYYNWDTSYINGDHYIDVVVTDSFYNATDSSDNSFSINNIPIITNVSVSNITTNSAVISWHTTNNTNSTVEYGLNTTYGSSAHNAASVRNHSITLTDLNGNRLYHFRVSGCDNGNCVYSDDHTFITLNNLPAITVLYPNGGEVLSSRYIEINWTASDPDNDPVSIDIYYDVDAEISNGRTLISADESNDGNYTWNLAYVNDGNYYISIDVSSYDLSKASDVTATDYSDNSFSKTTIGLGYTSNTYSVSVDKNTPPYVKVIAPDGFENINGTYTIKFNVFDAEGDILSASIYYSEIQGTKENTIAENLDLNASICTDPDQTTTTENGCSYVWDTTQINGNYYIDITVTDSIHNSTDSSASAFSVNNIPIITNVSVSNITANSAVISWHTTNDTNSIVEYGLNTSYGSSLHNTTPVRNHTIALTNLSGNKLYHFRAGGCDAAGNCVYSDDHTFITLNNLPAIIVLYPDGGEILSSKYADINWTASDPDNDTITIDIYYDTDTDINNGRTLIAADESNDGNYIWDLSGLPNGDYYISIDASNYDLQNQIYVKTTDYSDAAFTKASHGFTYTSNTYSATVNANTMPTVKITSPNEGDIIIGTEYIKFNVSDPEGDFLYANLYYSGEIYKRKLTVTNALGQDVEDYPVLLTMDTAALISAGKIRPDAIKVKIVVNGTEVPIYIEDLNTHETNIWFELDLPKGQTKDDIYLYYGDSTALAMPRSEPDWDNLLPKLNLLKGKPVISTSEVLPDYPATNSNDGSYGTRWVGTGATDWLKYNLSQTSKPYRVYYRLTGSGISHTLSRISTDGENYTTVVDANYSSGQIEAAHSFKPAEADFFLVDIRSNLGQREFYEVELYEPLILNAVLGDEESGAEVPIISNLDLSTIWYDPDSTSKTTNNCSYLWNMSLLDGVFCIKVEVTDFISIDNDTVCNITIDNINDYPVLIKPIPDQTWFINETKVDAFNLDDYFHDPDGDSLNYTVRGNTAINVTIDPVSHNVSFSQPYGWTGSEEVIFTADDGNRGITDSNAVSLTVREYPPVITNVTNSTPAFNSVTITWDTDKASDSLVKYGIESSNYIWNVSNATYVTSHIINLTGLSANTMYYYVVNSTDPGGNSNESDEYNFTTPSDTISPVVNSVTLSATAPNMSELILVTVNATDNVGVINVTAEGAELTFRGSNLWNGTVIAEYGLHYVNVTARDEAGNHGYNNTTYYIGMDNAAPVVNSVGLNITSPVLGDSILVTVNATDNIGVVKVTADGVELIQQYNPDIWNGTITAQSGFNRVNVSARDAAGNYGYNNTSSYTTLSYGVIIITPAGKTTYKGVNATYELTVTNTGNAADDFTLQVNNPDNASVAVLDKSSLTLGAVESQIIHLNVTNETAGIFNVTVYVASDNANATTENITTTVVAVSDIVITDMKWSSLDINDGDAVTFNATIKNNGTGNISGSFYNTFYIDGSSIGGKWVNGLSAADSININQTWTAIPGNHTISMLADSNNDVFEFNETNNNRSEALPGIEYADLIVSGLTWTPSNFTDGEIVTFNAVIENIGIGDTSRTFNTRFLIDDVSIGEKSISGLTSVSSTSVAQTWSATPGEHKIKAMVDSNLWVAESNESNNTMELNLTRVDLADLIVSSLSWTPSNFTDGEPVTFTAAIENIGAGNTTKDIRTTFYIDDISIGYKSISGLASSSSATITQTWSATPGEHKIKAIVDSNLWVAESNESNNTMELNLTRVDLADLIVSDLTWTPANFSDGEVVTFTASVNNTGIGNTTRGFYIKFLVDGTSIGEQYLSGLASSSSRNVIQTWTATPGEHIIKAEVDSRKNVVESNETNNLLEFNLSKVNQSDLIVSGLTWTPSTFIDGQSVKFNVTIENIGIGNISRAFYTSFLIDNVLIGGRWFSGLASGSSANADTTWIATPGEHTIKAVVDFYNNVAESNETNNSLEFNLNKIDQADLIVSSLTWTPSDFTEGQVVTFNAVIENAGNGNTTRGFYTRFLIDENYIGDRYFSGLSSGSSTLISQTWVATPGDHTIKAVVDANNHVSESNETNNSLSKDISYIQAEYLLSTGIRESYAEDEIATFSAFASRKSSPNVYLSDSDVSLNLTLLDQGGNTLLTSPMSYFYQFFFKDVDLAGYSKGSYTARVKLKDANGVVVEKSVPFRIVDNFSVSVSTDKTIYDRDEIVQITGHTQYPDGNPVPNAPVVLSIKRGYTQTYSLVTGSDGSFYYYYNPSYWEAGNFTAEASVISDKLWRNAETSFKMYGLYMTPSGIIDYTMSKNSSEELTFTLKNFGDSALHGVTVDIVDENTGDGVDYQIVQTPAQILEPNAQQLIKLKLTAGNVETSEANFSISVTTDEGSHEEAKLNVYLVEAVPIAFVNPTYITAGMNPENIQVRTVNVSNFGYESMKNVNISKPNLDWISTTSTGLGNISPYEKKSFDIILHPTNDTAPGVYQDNITISSSNHQPIKIYLTISVTSSQQGDLLFHVVNDIGENISGASITIQNQDVFTEIFKGTTNQNGYYLFDNISIGRYTYIAKASGHDSISNSVTISPEIQTLVEPVLPKNILGVQLTVTPITIGDTYDIQLNLTFETEVPPPVLMPSPLYISYGVNFTDPEYENDGSITISNPGLISIFNVTVDSSLLAGVNISFPTGMTFFIDEIKAKSSITIPYHLNVTSVSCGEDSRINNIKIRGDYIYFEENSDVTHNVYLSSEIPVFISMFNCPVSVNPVDIIIEHFIYNYHSPGGSYSCCGGTTPTQIRYVETVRERVKLSISQKATLERDAFAASLELTNKLADKSIESVNVDLNIKDKDGLDASNKFFVNQTFLNNINSLDGTGLINPSGIATADWLLIPKSGAGGTTPTGKDYTVQAFIDYTVDGVPFSVNSTEERINVLPQPLLNLTYMIPGEVKADTPFNITLNVTNVGYGTARNLKLDSAQPVIYDNKAGLLVSFELIGSGIEGGAKSDSMLINFGDIAPGESKTGYWIMTASLDGEFSEFKGSFSHSNALGGDETSLIRNITYVITQFTAEIISPEDGGIYYDFKPIYFEGTAHNGTEPYTYEWRTYYGGLLSSEPSFNEKLSVGSHEIKLKVTDNNGITDIDTHLINVIRKTMDVFVGPKYNQASKTLDISTYAFDKYEGDIVTSGATKYEILDFDGNPTGLNGNLLYNSNSKEWETKDVDVSDFEDGEYIVKVFMYDSTGYGISEKPFYKLEGKGSLYGYLIDGTQSSETNIVTIPGVEVLLFDSYNYYTNKEPVFIEISDDNGRYEFNNIVPGSYILISKIPEEQKERISDILRIKNSIIHQDLVLVHQADILNGEMEQLSIKYRDVIDFETSLIAKISERFPEDIDHDQDPIKLILLLAEAQSMSAPAAIKTYGGNYYYYLAQTFFMKTLPEEIILYQSREYLYSFLLSEKFGRTLDEIKDIIFYKNANMDIIEDYENYIEKTKTVDVSEDFDFTKAKEVINKHKSQLSSITNNNMDTVIPFDPDKEVYFLEVPKSYEAYMKTVRALGILKTADYIYSGIKITRNWITLSSGPVTLPIQVLYMAPDYVMSDFFLNEEVAIKLKFGEYGALSVEKWINDVITLEDIHKNNANFLLDEMEYPRYFNKNLKFDLEILEIDPPQSKMKTDKKIRIPFYSSFWAGETERQMKLDVKNTGDSESNIRILWDGNWQYEPNIIADKLGFEQFYISTTIGKSSAYLKQNEKKQFSIPYIGFYKPESMLNSHTLNVRIFSGPFEQFLLTYYYCVTDPVNDLTSSRTKEGILTMDNLSKFTPSISKIISEEINSSNPKIIKEFTINNNITTLTLEMNTFLGAPIDLHLYDEFGRHVGYNVITDNDDIEFPATYSGRLKNPERIVIPNAGNKTFTLQVGLTFSDYSPSSLVTVYAIETPERPSILSVSSMDIMMLTGHNKIVPIDLFIAESGGQHPIHNVNATITNITKDGIELPLLSPQKIEVGDISAGSADNATFILDIPGSIPDGNYTGIINVDSEIGPYPVKLTIQVTSKPDLKVSFIDVNRTVLAGNSTNITVIAGNQGFANVTNIKLELLVDDVLIESRTLDITSETFELYTFNWNAVSGNHIIKARIDPDDLSDEFNENNNEFEISINVNSAYDITPPSYITNLHSISGTTWINWTWTNPPEPDFNHTILYLNGTFITNIPTPQNYYNITGLTPDTQYELSTHTVDTSGNINTTWVNATARTLATADTTAPVITNVSAVPGTDGAVITWDTDEASDSLVKYGTSSGNYPFSESSSDMVLSHSLTLAGLTSDTLYYCVVNSTDAQGNFNESTEHTFSTLAPADTAPPTIESVTLDAYTTIANATIHVTVNAADNIGVTSVIADGSALTQDGNNWTGNLKVPSTAAPGTYSVVINASDAAGNTAESTATYTVVTPQGGVGIDLIPTDTTVDSGTSVTIIVKVTNTENFDDTFNVELTYDNIPAEYSDYKLDFNWTDWLDHRQRVSIKAKSSTEIPLTITVPVGEAGYKLYSITANSMNWVTAGSNTGGILVNTPAGDTTSPSIESVVLDASTTIANATILITVNATDDVGVVSVTASGASLTQDGNNWSGILKVPITAAPGTYSVAIQASDAAGNAAGATATYTVVTPQGGVGVDLIPTDTTVDSDTSVTIMVKVTNTENFDDTFNVELTYDNIPDEYSEYKLDFNWADWVDHKQQVSVKAKSSTEIPLTITVPTDGTGYKLYSVTARSMNWITVGGNTGGILIT